MTSTVRHLGWLLLLMLMTPSIAVAETLAPQPGETMVTDRPTIQAQPLQPDAYRELGQAILNHQRSPKNAIDYYAVGLALQNQNRWNDAIAAYRQAIRLDSKFALAYNTLANALMKVPSGRINLTPEVITAYQKAVELAPTHPRFFEDLANAARILREFGHYSQASQLFKVLITVKPNDAQTYVDYGLNLWYNQQPETAKMMLRLAIEHNPKDPEAYTVLGNVLAEQQQFKDALAHYRTAIDLEGEKVGSSLALSGIEDVLRQQNKLDEAIALERQLIQRYPNQPRLQERLQSLLKEQELQTDLNADPRLSPLPAQPNSTPQPSTPTNPPSQSDSSVQEQLYQRANGLRNQNQLDEAVKIYRQIIAQAPKSLRAYIELGDTLKLQNKLDEAIASYRQSVQLADQSELKAFLHNDIGLMLQQKGRLPAAIAEFRQAIQLLPNYNEAQENLQQAEQQFNSNSQKESAAP